MMRRRVAAAYLYAVEIKQQSYACSIKMPPRLYGLYFMLNVCSGKHGEMPHLKSPEPSTPPRQ